MCCSPWGRKESDTTEWLNGLSHAHTEHLVLCQHLVQWLTYPFIYCRLCCCNPNCRRGVSWSVKFHLKQGTKIPLYGMLTLLNSQDQLNNIKYQLLHSTLYGEDTIGMCYKPGMHRRMKGSLWWRNLEPYINGMGWCLTKNKSFKFQVWLI